MIRQSGEPATPQQIRQLVRRASQTGRTFIYPATAEEADRMLGTAAAQRRAARKAGHTRHINAERTRRPHKRSGRH